jgi:hypothetical protein
MTDALAPIRITAGEEDAQIDISQTYLRHSLHTRIRTELRGQRRRGGDEIDPMADDIQEAIKQLNQRDRALIESRIDNLDDDEIARRLSLPSAEAARRAVSRAAFRAARLLAKIRKGG